MIPETLVRLANLGRPRRPAGAREPEVEPVLLDPGGAAQQLDDLISRPVAEADLPALRHVQQLAFDAAEALLAGELPDCAAINAIAGGSTAHIELAATNTGGLCERLVWHDSSTAAELTRHLVEDLAALDAARLRCCARAECDLVFYDTTRSRTRRWHAEDPCGWRERQHHHRAHS